MKNVLIATVVTAVVATAVFIRVTAPNNELPPRGSFFATAERIEEAHAERLSAAERHVKAQLERDVAQQAASDRVVRLDGREVLGQIVSETADHVKIRQSFGDSGEMTLTIRRDNIRSVQPAAAEPPGISARDVRFKTEFPQLNLFRRPPYTIMTSEGFFDVQDVTRLLGDLHEDFVQVFRPVIANPERSDGIQLLFFSEEEDFRAYQRKVAPSMGFSVGFYNSGTDRFVIYDQSSSRQVRHAAAKLSSIKSQFERRYDSRQAKNAIQVWHQDQASSLHHHASRSNKQTLRHEGAHQLFHTYGVHSSHHAENLWLIEGLAVYCENERIGNRPTDRLAALREVAGKQSHIPFPKLINFRSPRGFGGIGRGNEAVSLAYAQSWLVVDYAMRHHQKQLFDYLCYVRDPRNTGALGRQSRFQTLCQFLKMTPAELEQALVDELQRI